MQGGALKVDAVFTSLFGRVNSDGDGRGVESTVIGTPTLYETHLLYAASSSVPLERNLRNWISLLGNGNRVHPVSSVRTNSPGSWHLFRRKLPAISTSLREATFVLGLLVLGIANCKLKDVLQRRPGNLGSIARGFVRLAIGVAWDITAQCDSLTETNFDAAFV